MDLQRSQFEITHPFHPWHGRRFELANEQHRWGRHWLDAHADDGRLFSVPVEWTDRTTVDAYVAISAGRSLFRVDELLRLVTLIDGLTAVEGGGRAAPDGAATAPASARRANQNVRSSRTPTRGQPRRRRPRRGVKEKTPDV